MARIVSLGKPPSRRNNTVSPETNPRQVWILSGAEGFQIEQRLDIYPGVGIGPIRHGMRPAEVLAVFTEPQVYEDWMGGNLNDALLFRGLRLHFSVCDSCAPLPNSTLNWVVIHQRPDAFLFGRPVGKWTKETVLAELRARGYVALTPPNGDVEVYGKLGLSFEDDGRLIWVEVYAAPGTSLPDGGS